MVVVAAPVIGAAPLLYLGDGADQSDSASAGTIIFLVIFALVVLAAVVSAGITLSGVDPEADEIADRLVPAPNQQLLIARWLRRTRWARNVGGAAGLLWWVIGTQARGPILVLGLGGVAIGSMAAQLHQVRPRSGLRTASLEQRSIARYAPTSTQRQLALSALGAVVVAVIGVIGLVRIDDAGSTPMVWAGAALAVVAIAVGLQYRVSHRPRPALGPELRYADDLARSLAVGRGLGEPAGYWATALLASGASALEPVIGPLALMLSGVLWFYAVLAWWQNRRLGLSSLSLAP